MLARNRNSNKGLPALIAGRALPLISLCALGFAYPAAASAQLAENSALSIVELPCTYQPASIGGRFGYIQIVNVTPNELSGGLPVNYRLSSTGGEFTFHMPDRQEQWNVARIKHTIR